MSKSLRDKITFILRIVILLTSAVGVTSIILEYGFNRKPFHIEFLPDISVLVILIFFLYQIINYLLALNKREYLREHKIELVLLFLILTEIIVVLFDMSLVKTIGRTLDIKNMTFLYVVIAQIFIVIEIIGAGLRYNNKILQLQIHPSKLFLLSFFIVIVIGTLFLMMPAASQTGYTKPVDALFTATSAVCVTGLSVVDTATHFTRFGQVVIMILVQIGGLGVMTFATFFAMFVGGRMGIKEKIMMHDLLEEDNIGTISRVITFLIVMTFILEFIGAVSIYASIHHKYSSMGEAIFTSVFHSITAFCNAGFSLYSQNLLEPLVRDNFQFTFTISLLIIIGGIGFPTLMSLSNFNISTIKKEKIKYKVPVQTKIIIKTTLALIILGTLFTFLNEYNYSLKDLGIWDKVYHAYFQAISARTAGFNTVDVAHFGYSAIMIFVLLMFIGAAPGGTGGGLKVTTFVVAVRGIFSLLRGEKQLIIENRAISRDIIAKALGKTVLSFFVIWFSIYLLSMTEHVKFEKLVFETFSAFGTVGLSLGITPDLTPWGKLIITIVMFMGRVGVIAFILAVMKSKEPLEHELPGENISII